MFRIIFLIFFIIKLEVHSSPEEWKIVKAHIKNYQWKLLEQEQEDNGLDLFSKRKLEDKQVWEVILRVHKTTIDFFKEQRIPFNVTVPDTHTIFRDRKFSHRKAFKNQTITFAEYLSFEQIMEYLKKLPRYSNSYRNISVTSIGTTLENRDVMLVKIEFRNATDIMFFDGGIHAREWLSVMQAMYIIKKVVALESCSELTQVNWFIVPCLNPDGYVFSQHTSDNRLQRKNMNRQGCPSSCNTCGVDLNRNFGFKFGVSGSSNNPCSEIYKGQFAFSEPETQALRTVLDKHAPDIKLYLSFHSYGPIILYPWGYAEIKCDDWEDLEIAGIITRDAINSYSKDNTQYGVVNTGQGFYPAAGGSDDYAKHLGIKYSFTMELQSGGDTGFDPYRTDIKKIVKENYVGVTALVNYIQSGTVYDSRNFSTNLNNSFIIRSLPAIIILILHGYNFRFTE